MYVMKVFFKKSDFERGGYLYVKKVFVVEKSKIYNVWF